MQHAYRDDEMVVVGPMTAEEYFAEAPRASDKPRDARKAELIDGVLILFPSPLDVHERLYVFLLRLLGEYAERMDLGEVRGSRSAVKLAEDQIYQPDVLFVSRDRLSLFERQGIFGPPDLVIEILSRSTASYDRGAKLRTYDRAGVREIWLVDPAGYGDPSAAGPAPPARDPRAGRHDRLARAPRLGAEGEDSELSCRLSG